MTLRDGGLSIRVCFLVLWYKRPFEDYILLTSIRINSNYITSTMRATDSQTKPSTLGPFRLALYHTKTLYLFTKSDIKTTILPDVRSALTSLLPHSSSVQFCIAIALTRQTSPVYLLTTVLWIWLILLTFCVSNQASTQSLIEDQVNKPWRPIPSSRISVKQARILRWILVFVSLLVSAYLGNLVSATIFLLADLVYNDFGFSTWWFTKSLLNAVGYAGFQHGAVAVAYGNVLRIYYLRYIDT